MTELSAEDIWLRRTRIRCWRRGMKEMDLILGGFADAELTGLDAPERAAFDRLLEENDQELFDWINGRGTAPPEYRALIAVICAFHKI